MDVRSQLLLATEKINKLEASEANLKTHLAFAREVCTMNLKNLHNVHCQPHCWSHWCLAPTASPIIVRSPLLGPSNIGVQSPLLGPTGVQSNVGIWSPVPLCPVPTASLPLVSSLMLVSGPQCRAPLVSIPHCQAPLVSCPVLLPGPTGVHSPAGPHWCPIPTAGPTGVHSPLPGPLVSGSPLSLLCWFSGELEEGGCNGGGRGETQVHGRRATQDKGTAKDRKGKVDH